MESLPNLIAFVRTAEESSFVAAGRSLGLSASAVGKSVARLEDALGARLLRRTTRRVSLTEEGALFYERCRRILDELAEAEALVREAAETPRGRLRVSLPTIGYRFLAPALPAFQRRYPEVELDLDFNDRLVDLVEEGVDLAIRSGALSGGSLMSRRLGAFRFTLCAAPRYLDDAPALAAPRDLARHACLRFRFPSTGKLQDWALGAEAGDWRYGRALVTNNMEGLRAAAIEGLGVAYMPDFLAQDAVESGALRPVLEAWRGEGGAFTALWASSRHRSPKLRAFLDHLAGALFKPTPPEPPSPPR